LDRKPQERLVPNSNRPGLNYSTGRRAHVFVVTTVAILAIAMIMTVGIAGVTMYRDSILFPSNATLRGNLSLPAGGLSPTIMFLDPTNPHNDPRAAFAGSLYRVTVPNGHWYRVIVAYQSEYNCSIDPFGHQSCNAVFCEKGPVQVHLYVGTIMHYDVDCLHLSA